MFGREPCREPWRLFGGESWMEPWMMFGRELWKELCRKHCLNCLTCVMRPTDAYFEACRVFDKVFGIEP